MVESFMQLFYLPLLHFSHDEKARNVKPRMLHIGRTHQPFYILICISTLPRQHTTFITLSFRRGVTQNLFVLCHNGYEHCTARYTV